MITQCEKERGNTDFLRRGYIPQCSDEGEYEKVQCRCRGRNDHLKPECQGATAVKQCWCVDEFGKQIPGTGMPLADYVDCEKGEYVTWLRDQVRSGQSV